MFMTIANPEFLAAVSDGYLRHAIREGRPGTPMLGFAGQLTDQTIDDLVALIRSWQVDPTQVAAAKPVWPDELAQNPEGDDPELPEGRFVKVDELNAALSGGKKLIIADARAPTDYVTKHIAGAVSVPFYDAELYVDKLPKDVSIVAYCGCPHAASGALVDSLERSGFTRAKVLDEGYFVWVERGYPLNEGPNP
jgi:cytochrome c oxidase cbb3-type subunit 3/ubiquinol-cytochrome c reductase cytochrome c subunit